ncbi:hypothetical protein FB451DRAFT_1174700 [Mycena latifolia]|nr:hypothetical protein FB451DRAFT_1174700 [Mycena latifolia]
MAMARGHPPQGTCAAGALSCPPAHAWTMRHVAGAISRAALHPPQQHIIFPITISGLGSEKDNPGTAYTDPTRRRCPRRTSRGRGSARVGYGEVEQEVELGKKDERIQPGRWENKKKKRLTYLLKVISLPCVWGAGEEEARTRRDACAIDPDPSESQSTRR